MMRDGSGCSRVNWLLHLQSRSGHPHLVQVLPVSVEYTVRELRSVIGTDYQGGGAHNRVRPSNRRSGLVINRGRTEGQGSTVTDQTHKTS